MIAAAGDVEPSGEPAPSARDASDGATVLVLTFKGDEASVRGGLDRVQSWLWRQLLPLPLRDRVMIVLAEALNNVVEHAFADVAPGRIDLSLACSVKGVTIEIADDGRPMPGNAPPPRQEMKVDVPRHELPEGGFGWTLIHDLASEITYRRAGRANRLRLVIGPET